jgi:hypothetical protein
MLKKFFLKMEDPLKEEEGTKPAVYYSPTRDGRISG